MATVTTSRWQAASGNDVAVAQKQVEHCFHKTATLLVAPASAAPWASNVVAIARLSSGLEWHPPNAVAMRFANLSRSVATVLMATAAFLTGREVDPDAFVEQVRETCCLASKKARNVSQQSIHDQVASIQELVHSLECNDSCHQERDGLWGRIEGPEYNEDEADYSVGLCGI